MVRLNHLRHLPPIVQPRSRSASDARRNAVLAIRLAQLSTAFLLLALGAETHPVLAQETASPPAAQGRAEVEKPEGTPVESSAPQPENTATTAEPPAPAPADAKAATPARPPDRFLSLDSRTLSGDWGGLRNELADKGIKINLFVNDQFQTVARGGLDTESTGRNSASTDLFITADLDKLGVIKNGEMLGHFQSNCGAGINPYTGTLYEVNDDADGNQHYHVAQLWYRHYFADHKIHLTLGYLDFQTVVDRNAFANSEDKQFWNQALDNNPLVPLNIGLGATLIAQPTKWFSLVLGVADDQSVLYKPGFSTAFHDEALFRAYVETDFHADWPSRRGPLPGNLRLGTVYDPGTFTEFAQAGQPTSTRSEQYIFFVSADQLLFREGKTDEQGLGIFGRYSYRDPEINRVFQHWSAGLQYRGAIPGRDNDVIALAVAQQQTSHKARRRVDARLGDETVYELYYAFQMAEWLVISPDVQYIDNPGANDEVGHTVVAGIRVRISV